MIESPKVGMRVWFLEIGVGWWELNSGTITSLSGQGDRVWVEYRGDGGHNQLRPARLFDTPAFIPDALEAEAQRLLLAAAKLRKEIEQEASDAK